MFHTPSKTTARSSRMSRSKEKTIDDLTVSKNVEENVKPMATPRSYAQKTTAADIYSQKKPVQRSSSTVSMKSSTKLNDKLKTPLATPRQTRDIDKNKLNNAPHSKKVVSRTGTAKISSQPKTSSITKTKSLTNTSIASTSKSKKNELPMNVTVNSPLTRKKLNNEAIESKKPMERRNTMILDENDTKVISKMVTDNESENRKLHQKFKAAPKAYYIEIGDGDKTKPKPSTSKRSNAEESPAEDSYEDDFESYESDFESYSSENSNSDEVIPISEVKLEDSDSSETNLLKDSNYTNKSKYSNEGFKVGLTGDQFSDMLSKKYGKDEERKLDSGNFDLSERRSAKSTPMAEITEGAEERKSLPDEGFQDMSESQNVKVNVERPLFINFQKSKENKRKRQSSDRLHQRAKDLLSIITLHEMHYNLFEMKPIPYELYMATFGRANYTQTACQTFEDGISQETQTEDIEMRLKWTQYPTDFTYNDICYNEQTIIEKNVTSDEVYLKNFTFLQDQTIAQVAEKNISRDTEVNHLKVFLEQKQGGGDDKMMTKDKYNEIIENTDYNMQRLKKFLKKVEGRITNALNSNLGEKNFGELLRTTNYSFSKGYVSLQCKNSNLDYLKTTQISNVVFSETRCNLFFTVHRKEKHNCLCCLWDVSLNNLEPLKIVGALEDIVIAKFKGGTEGILVAALVDSSIHLWDLSEDPRLFKDSVASQENKTQKLIQVDTAEKSQTEIDREWNALNKDNYSEPYPDCIYSSAYTSSGVNMSEPTSGSIVAVEYVDKDLVTYSQDGGRKVVGQIASLQNNGYLTIWLIIQERNTKKQDIGKAYWSKYKLEKSINIAIAYHIEQTVENNGKFNLNSTKKRLSDSKSERNKIKKQISRPSSSRPQSAANLRGKIKKQMLPGEWDSGVLCTDLKVARHNNMDVFLVSKNCGEVLLCTKFGGTVKIKKLVVCSKSVTVTCISTSPHSLSYFLAATNSGTIHLCSFQDTRVLLTLDCRNIPKSSTERYQTDLKGRFIGTVEVKPLMFDTTNEERRQLSITSLYWQPSNPCQLVSVTQDGGTVTWDLTFSDIYGKKSGTNTVICTGSDEYFATLTTEDEIQIHKLHAVNKNKNIELFEKYVARL